MSEQKLNRRVQHTRKALREALIDLISEKPLASITVTDICSRADINRSTFYLHYQGVHDLLGEIEGQILQRMDEQLARTPSLQTLTTLAEFVDDLRRSPRTVKLFAALGGEQGDPHFVRAMQQLTYDAFQRGWQNTMPETSDSYKHFVFTYTVPGIISVLSEWVMGRLTGLSADELVVLLETITAHGIHGVSQRLQPPGS